MNRTDSLAIVDTDREELRDRIDVMRQRFYRLALCADPSARRSAFDWTVQQIVAHVLSVACRYKTFAETGDFVAPAIPANSIRSTRRRWRR